MRPRTWLLLSVFLLSPPAWSAPTRTIELILDASGSMNATLPSGETRLAAAKAAVAKIVPTLPGDTTLAFRAYGFQSPRDKHDCDDTALLVPFSAASGNGATVVKAAQLLKAQGYTPISRVIRQAAADLAETEPGERVILLVSDGKETCDTDPCATARALKAADASLVIHAIGFEVDSGARGELQCVAASTGGTYLDASGAAGLAEAIGQASVKSMAQVPVEGKEPGNLEIKNANPNGHDVLDAVTGAKAGDISSFRRVIRVPPGIYNVTFGKSGLWRGVEVHSKGATVLDPAVLEIENAAMNGNQVLDSETGAEIAELSSFTRTAALVPGLYDVTFGGTVWRNLRLDGGTKTVLHPGVLVLEGASPNGHKVFDASGKLVAEPTAFASSVALVPGPYTVVLGTTPKAIVLAEGQKLILQVPK
jgi:hypothetical protein